MMLVVVRSRGRCWEGCGRTEQSLV